MEFDIINAKIMSLYVFAYSIILYSCRDVFVARNNIKPVV